MNPTWQEILTSWQETQITFSNMNQQLTDSINEVLMEYAKKYPQQQATVADIINLLKLIYQLNATTNV